MALPFDRVIVETASGPQRLSVQAFSAIPLAERVRALLEKRVAFYLGDKPVEQGQALAALRNAAG